MTAKKITADQLAEAEGEFRSVSKRAEILGGVRNDLVRRALAEGWTHARIAEATGLSRGRINQIAQSRG